MVGKQVWTFLTLDQLRKVELLLFWKIVYISSILCSRGVRRTGSTCLLRNWMEICRDSYITWRKFEQLLVKRPFLLSQLLSESTELQCWHFHVLFSLISFIIRFVAFFYDFQLISICLSAEHHLKMPATVPLLPFVLTLTINQLWFKCNFLFEQSDITYSLFFFQNIFLAGLVINLNQLTIGRKMTMNVMDGSRISSSAVGPAEDDPLSGPSDRTVSMQSLHILTGLFPRMIRYCKK